MRRSFYQSLLIIMIGLFAGGAVAAPPQAQPAIAKQQFVKPVSLRGTLGGVKIQANLRTKAEFEDGIEGEYFMFGQSQKVLLAGEIEGDELFLEESENGTDVSGQWSGKLVGDAITGEWQSVDGTVIKPFHIRIVRTTEKVTPIGTGKSVSQGK